MRIRSVPERRGEDLRKVIGEFFSPILGIVAEDFPNIERVHQVGRSEANRPNRTRDIIARFRFFEDKAKIWVNIRGKTPLQFYEIQVFADLAPETLARRRMLEPLLDQMRIQNIKYNWGFPACLIGSKDGRSARLRFPDELGDFCKKLEIQEPSLPEWCNEWKEGGAVGFG